MSQRHFAVRIYVDAGIVRDAVHPDDGWRRRGEPAAETGEELIEVTLRESAAELDQADRLARGTRSERIVVKRRDLRRRERRDVERRPEVGGHRDRFDAAARRPECLRRTRSDARSGAARHPAVVESEYALDDVRDVLRHVDGAFASAIGLRRRFVAAEVDAERVIHLFDGAEDLHDAARRARLFDLETFGARERDDEVEVGFRRAEALGELFARQVTGRRVGVVVHGQGRRVGAATHADGD